MKKTKEDRRITRLIVFVIHDYARNHWIDSRYYARHFRRRWIIQTNETSAERCRRDVKRVEASRGKVERGGEREAS